MMVHWIWLVVTAVVFGTLGVVLMGQLAAGASEEAYRSGYNECQWDMEQERTNRTQGEA